MIASCSSLDLCHILGTPDLGADHDGLLSLSISSPSTGTYYF